MRFPTSVDPVNAILSMPSVRDERGAGLARPGDDVDDPVGQTGVLEDLRQVQGGERRRFGGLEDDGIAAGERGRDFPRRHEQRKIPWDDLAADAERPRLPSRKSEFEFVRPPGMVKEVSGDQRQVDIAGLADRFAAVHGFEHREFAGFFLDHAGDAKEVFPALASGHRAPRLLERLARRPHRAIDVCLRRPAPPRRAVPRWPD